MVRSEDAEIDLGMSADFVYPSGATAHFDSSFVGGDKAGPVIVTVTVRFALSDISEPHLTGGRSRIRW